MYEKPNVGHLSNMLYGGYGLPQSVSDAYQKIVEKLGDKMASEYFGLDDAAGRSVAYRTDIDAEY